MTDKRYQVVGHLALITQNTVNGPVKTYAYRGALVGESTGTTAKEIARHAA